MNSIDISNRKKMEENLKESEERFKSLFENTLSGVFYIEPNGQIIEANTQILKMLDSPSIEETKKINVLDYKPLKQIGFSEQLKKCIETRQSVFGETTYKSKWNKTSHVKYYFNPISRDNKLIGVLANIEDITEQEKANRLEKEIEITKKSAEIKQQFLANMSHEIRTPMNCIVGTIDFMLQTRLSKKQMEFINIIEESSNQLINIINDILDISRIEAGKMTLHPRITNLLSTMDKVKSFFKASAKRKKIKLNFNYPDNLPNFILIDENRLIQIVSNLVSNAIKFTEKGGVTIKLSILGKEKDLYQFKVEVIDTGIGISQTQQKKLFTKFTQLDSSQTREFEGSGLGLAISRELAILMGGNIGLESEKDKGSNFYFVFKAKQITLEKPLSINTERKELKDVSLNMHILLTEDKFLNQKVVSLMLENAGCTVDIAANGFIAIEKIKEKTYDAVLMDIQMPVMDGITAVKKLRKMKRKLPPIIGLSANAMEGDAEHYKSEGMDDYISKPVKPNELYRKLIKWA